MVRVHEVVQEQVVLREHLSSVKCMYVAKQEQKELLLIVTGGGRAELRVWSVVSSLKEELAITPATSIMARENRMKEAEKENSDGVEMRLLCSDTAWEDTDTLNIFLACSDSILRIFRCSVSSSSLQLVREVLELCDTVALLKGEESNQFSLV